MAAMVAMGSSPLSPSIPVQEKGNRNKRKCRTDPPLDDPNKLSTSQTECLNHEFPIEKSQNNSNIEQGVCDMCRFTQDELGVFRSAIIRSQCVQGSSNLVCDQPREELEGEECQHVGWSDIMENQLEELVLSNLDMTFKSAIKEIASYGYSEEVATKAVLRSGLCYGCKDTISNIVENALAFLKNIQEIDTSRDHFFHDLHQLEGYVLAEMVCLLREVRPSFSTGDAMWCLLICDMNVSHACAMDSGDPFSSFCNDEMVATSVSMVPQPKSEASNSIPGMPEHNIPRPNKMNPLFLHPQSSQPEMPVVSDHGNPLVFGGLYTGKESSISSISSFGTVEESFAVPSTSQSSAPEAKLGSSRKCQKNSSKRESALRQKSGHLEKHYRSYGTKAALRTGVSDKKCKSVSNSTASNMKNASLRLSRAVEADASQADENFDILINEGANSALGLNPKASNGLHTFPTPNTELSLSLPSKINGASRPNCNVNTASCSNYWILPELQTQMQEWTKWVEEKVMQATRRLSMDNAELKTLRQEKEEVARLQKEKQALEDNTMKKLSEMENALRKASCQVERANAAVRRLEVENSELKREMEAAKLRAAESAANCQEVSRREKKTLKKFESWERQKALFQEELVTEKHKLSQLRQQLQQAKEFQEQLEARWRQEDKAKEEALTQANSVIKEREQIEASAKSKEDLIRLKAESGFQRYKDDIQKLENEIAQLRDSSKIAALHWGTDGTYASRLMEGRSTHALKEIYTSYMSEMEDFQDLGDSDVRRERECVMCLTEEMSVVFLPCAHQIVCMRCNELHEKQGMKDCPSCRTPIQRRICARSAYS